LEYYTSLGFTFIRVLADNSACCPSNASIKVLKSFGMNHIRTKLRAPLINGKAEDFI